MQHALHAEGFGIRLRPVQMDDAAFIVWLRNLDHAKGRVGDSATNVAGQQTWLRAYFARQGDYYFIVETAGEISVGTYAIYDVHGASAESGRWIIRPEVLAAIPGAILTFDLAFGKLGLSELRVRTILSNQPVLSLNRKFGFRQVRVETNAQVIGGKSVDMVQFHLTATEWIKVREQLVPLAKMAQTQVREWEQAQHSSAKSCCGQNRKQGDT
jgi:RimJ/RimL family protein N-acetyltransferase